MSLRPHIVYVLYITLLISTEKNIMGYFFLFIDQIYIATHLTKGDSGWCTTVDKKNIKKANTQKSVIINTNTKNTSYI